MNTLFYAIVYFCSLQSKTAAITKCTAQISSCMLDDKDSTYYSEYRLMECSINISANYEHDADDRNEIAEIGLHNIDLLKILEGE